MITFPMLPEVEIELLLLVFICLSVGVLSGFTGVSGAYLVMPALIMLGFPANFAVGTTLTWVTGNSVLGALRHRKLGNVDIKLGLVMIWAVIGGTEVGVRVINRARDLGLANEVVLSVSIFLLLAVGIYTLAECLKTKRRLDQILRGNGTLPRELETASLAKKLCSSIRLFPMLHFTRSGVTVSLWVLVVIGFSVGITVGILGVGGGFIMVPALVYIIGMSSLTAIGTSLFQIIFAAAYGSIRHTMSGNVIIFASVIMIVASSIGIQFGATVTRYVHGVSVRCIISISILVAAVSIILKLLSILLVESAAWLGIGSLALIFGSMALMLIMIILLFVMGYRLQRGKYIPMWGKSLVARRHN